MSGVSLLCAQVAIDLSILDALSEPAEKSVVETMKTVRAAPALLSCVTPARVRFIELSRVPASAVDNLSQTCAWLSSLTSG